MFYVDDFCCCVDLKSGCIIIAIIEVIVRGLDGYFADRDSLLGYVSIGIIGLYLLCCVILLIGALLNIRHLLLPYLFAALIHIVVMTVQCVYVIITEEFYDYMIFDICEAVITLYFCLVVHSYYYALR